MTCTLFCTLFEIPVRRFHSPVFPLHFLQFIFYFVSKIRLLTLRIVASVLYGTEGKKIVTVKLTYIKTLADFKWPKYSYVTIWSFIYQLNFFISSYFYLFYKLMLFIYTSRYIYCLFILIYGNITCFDLLSHLQNTKK